MHDTIALLPDHVANQIAAGEVVQRPASVVKELIENAIDAGATQITLVIKDAGKTLIQVTDNGKGMSPMDSRMCFERHATSKISSADDLLKLSTKGFRGEALASIAAVAQVELKTRQPHDEVGQHIIIEGGRFVSQEEIQTATGTTFIVKNLFFNIPARRTFLKSDQIEQKHIIEEVERVAIPHTGISFVVKSNGNEVLNLPAGNLMQRIKSLFGGYIQKELVLIGEDTSYVKISGYVSLPSAALKTRKDQYFFVNNRFVKNPFLNHAIYEAYKELIGYQSHPRYFIFLQLDPSQIDINIHPTKIEVKFSDERTVYMLLLSAVKRAIGKANASGGLDFDAEMSIEIPAGGSAGTKLYKQPPVSYNTSYNPFNPNQNTPEKSNRQHWQSLFEGFSKTVPEENKTPQQEIEPVKLEAFDAPVFQLHRKYIVTSFNQNVVIIDQQRAHERVLYEHYINAAEERPVHSQQLLFPEQLELSATDFAIVQDLIIEFRQLGFNLEIFGRNSIVINGLPADMEGFNIRQTLEGIIETFKLNTIEARVEKKDNLCRSIARNIAIRQGKELSEEEMKLLISSLLRCENPLYTAAGKVVMMDVEYKEIEKFFRK